MAHLHHEYAGGHSSRLHWLHWLHWLRLHGSSGSKRLPDPHQRAGEAGSPLQAAAHGFRRDDCAAPLQQGVGPHLERLRGLCPRQGRVGPRPCLVQVGSEALGADLQALCPVGRRTGAALGLEEGSRDGGLQSLGAGGEVGVSRVLVGREEYRLCERLQGCLAGRERIAPLMTLPPLTGGTTTSGAAWRRLSPKGGCAPAE
mmetsp:Transcript_15668/g.34487  ORF Transcript_15668/g.34487 Transcript_15668/m.34487 type:complete len:201 (+) Transcript_15668:494-1096(+)